MTAAAQAYAWLVFLGAWAHMGWVDWREQKIRNRYLGFWLKLVAAGWLVLAAHSLLGHLGHARVYVLWGWYSAVLGHALFAVLAAAALWGLRVWPAGDVKLYALLALCVPLTRVPSPVRPGTLFLEALINIFVPAAAFLFLTAGAYLWRTRFAGRLGRAADWLRGRPAAVPAAVPSAEALASAPAVVGPARASEPVPAPAAPAWSLPDAEALAAAARSAALPVREVLLGWWEEYRAEPSRFFKDVASWLVMMAVMSMISYYLNDFVPSTVLKTLICFALMFAWSRFCQLIGTGWAMGGLFVALAALLRLQPNVSLPGLAVVFGHITVFSLCIFLGIQIAFRILAGKTGWAYLPALMMFVGLVPWSWILGSIWTGAVAVLRFLGGAGSAGLSGAAGAARDAAGAAAAGARAVGGISLPAPEPPPVPAIPLPHLPAFLSGLEGSGLGTWAAMGLFFGLALVFVRIWDAESFKSVPVAHIEPFMTLGPSLVARIEADEDFRDEHFPTFYADGLTRDQAEALKEWCENEKIETVPLAPTISFANWIFLGWFLTRLLDGHVLRFLY